MEPKKNNSERMRPILQAMERSIDTARRNRVGQAPLAPPPAAARVEAIRPALAMPSPIPAITDAIPFGEQNGPRLKARPKRFDSPLINPFEKSPYRTQAG